MFIGCSDNMSGGPGGQTTNGITATLLSSLDTLALDSAMVSLRHIDYLAGSEIIVDTTEYLSAYNTSSKADGSFEISSIKPGKYLLECLFKDSLGVIETLSIESESSFVDLKNLFAMEVGTISGTIDTNGIPENSKIEILIKGVEKSVVADNDGDFLIKSLAPWSYSFIVNVISPEDTVTEEINDVVYSGTITQLDTIDLYAPYNPFQYLKIRTFLDNTGLSYLDVDSVVLHNNGQIYKLDLSKLNLTSIDSSLCELDFLNEIYFSNNKLESLPADMGNMASLKTVELCFNSFSIFPIGLTTLDSVEHICLDNNSIDTLPYEIANIPTLKILDVETNNLTKLPITISHLKNLTKIDIDSNNVSYLPEVMMDSLVNLDSIELTYNSIDTADYSPAFIQWLNEKSDNIDWISLQE